ncbi:unnamed protein product [Parajaminaea phylloscopi]
MSAQNVNAKSSAPTTSTGSFSISSLFGVTGKRVLITGAGSGLGSYAAVGLALNGAKVFIVGRRLDRLQSVAADFEQRKSEQSAPQEAAQGAIVPLQGDISSKEGLLKLVQDYSKHESYLDALVNGAGVLGDLLPIKPEEKDDASKVQPALWSEEWDNWSSVLNTNTIAPYFTTLAFVPLLSAAKPRSMVYEGPVVVNITSTSAFASRRDSDESHAYATSKGAAEHVTKILAGRLIPYKIRVNSIAPGIFPSEMTGKATPEAYLEKAIKGVPALQRSGTPEDFVGVILYTLSRAGAYLTGATIVADGARAQTTSSA